MPQIRQKLPILLSVLITFISFASGCGNMDAASSRANGENGGTTPGTTPGNNADNSNPGTTPGNTPDNTPNNTPGNTPGNNNGTGGPDGESTIMGGTAPESTDVTGIQERLNNGAVSIAEALVDPTPNGSPTVEGVTDWYNGARAGYSMIHDDVCDYQMSSTEGLDGKGWKIAESHGFSVGWGIIVSRCIRSGYGSDSATYWGLIDDMIAGGQEIVNHSWNHPNLKGISDCKVAADAGQTEAELLDICPSQFKNQDGTALRGTASELAVAAEAALQLELIESSDEIQRASSMDSFPEFYAFPLDVATDDILARLSEKGLMGSRGGDRDTKGTLNSYSPEADYPGDPLADFRILFDAYNEDSPYATRHGVNGTDHALTTYLNDTVIGGKWGLRELHGIRPTCSTAGHGWGPVTLKLYEDHLDNVACRVDARQVWMASNVDIIKYRRSNLHCGNPVLSGTSLSFDGASDPDCIKYATPVTVAIQGPADTTISGVSGNTPRANTEGFVNLPNGRVLVNMLPTETASITFGSGTTPAASATCSTALEGLPTSCVPEPGETICAPLGACTCTDPIATVASTYSGAVEPWCTDYKPGGEWNEVYLGAADFNWAAASNTGGGYYAFPNRQWAGRGGSQYGAQMSFFPAGYNNDKSCADLSGKTIEICVKGQMKNGFPVTRYVGQGDYNLSDTSRDPNEIQNVVWAYLMIEETKYAGDEYSKGSCLATGICTHPFVPIELKEDGSEVCIERTIKDFQFPYWWGAPNVGFAYPESCGAPGSAPSADSCQEREDADPGTEEPLAGWHLCDAAAAKSMSIVISAVDDTGTKPVETVDLQAKVTVR